MNFVEYTENIIDREIKLFGEERYKYINVFNLLVIGAGYKVRDAKLHVNVVAHDPTKDIAEWIYEHRLSDRFQLFDVVIASRVFEHIPARNIDWYLCNIYSIMRPKGRLICVVPNMPNVVNQLNKEFAKQQIDLFKINRLHFELFSEGPSVWDRHACWMSEESIRYYLEMEGLFEVKEINTIRIDSDIVPNELEVIAVRR